MPRVFHQPLKEKPETEAQLPTTSVSITACPIGDDQQTENCVEGSYIQRTLFERKHEQPELPRL